MDVILLKLLIQMIKFIFITKIIKKNQDRIDKVYPGEQKKGDDGQHD
jgi:hypothetical protein